MFWGILKWIARDVLSLRHQLRRSPSNN